MTTVDDRALLLALLDAAADAIIVSDSDGTILRLNTAAAALFGYGVDGLIGRNVRMLMPRDLATQHDGFMRHHLDTGDKRIIGIGRDVEGLRADGTVFPLHLSVGRADLDSEAAFVAILHDQTRRKAAEEAAARSQRMDAIGQMTGGIAHDFNNLLTVVIRNLELLEMCETDDKKRALIVDALEAAELGADLTSRLMVFARKSTLKSGVIAMNDAVLQSLAMLKRTIGSHILVETSLADDLWSTRADAAQLQTAVLNLGLNAQDAMQNGGRIVVETRNVTLDDSYIGQEIGVDLGEYIRLSVSDTGTGMPADTRRLALEPFFTTKSVGKGTGLGHDDQPLLPARDRHRRGAAGGGGRRVGGRDGCLRQHVSDPAHRLDQLGSRRIALGRVVRGAPAAAQNRANPRQRLAHVEGIRQVIVRAQLQAQNAVDHVILAGHHHDRNVVAVPNGPGDIQPVFAAEVEIERHEIGRAAVEGPRHACAILRFLHEKPIRLQAPPKKSPNVGVVVVEDTFLGHGRDPVNSRDKYQNLNGIASRRTWAGEKIRMDTFGYGRADRAATRKREDGRATNRGTAPCM